MSEGINEEFQISVHEDHITDRREEYTSQERVRFQVDQQLLLQA